jgi:hypothetical protein
MARAIIRKTPKFTIRISEVMLAEVPSDGGKWVLYCDHFDTASGEWLNAGLIQDNNKRILAPHRKDVRGAGYCDWCEECQNAHREETGEW